MSKRRLIGLGIVLVSLFYVTPIANGTTPQVNARLARQVRHELVTLPYYGVYDWLQFEARSDGTVVLSGQVVRPTTKSDAESRVREVDGVRQVVNQIQVLPLS